MKVCENNQPLASIVCGFERGGTTLVTEILRQHPKLDGGFEGGFLLVKDNVSEFLSIEPYSINLKRGWDISEDEFLHICSADNWPEVYKRLVEYSRLIQFKDTLVFDKTPKYMSVLPNVLDKVPNVPCIVVVRDPRSVLWSWAKRSDVDKDTWICKLENHCARYIAYANGWKAAIEDGMGSRILLVKYEELCKNPNEIAREIFNFIGLDFVPEYVELRRKSKFPNVRGNSVSNEFLKEYKGNLPEDICRNILDLTYEFSEWFWEPA
ncbi:MAG: sulfotransferase [Synechococcales bacterium]|nr:sulfotransferase [Synechococcales bacterium]